MTLEEKMVNYREICRQIRQLEADKKALGQVILKEMPSKKMVFDDFIARGYTRLSIRVPIEQARILDATKMVEQVDKDRIKHIYESGAVIEGVKEISYLIVTSARPSLGEEVPAESLAEDVP